MKKLTEEDAVNIGIKRGNILGYGLVFVSFVFMMIALFGDSLILKILAGLFYTFTTILNIRAIKRVIYISPVTDTSQITNTANSTRQIEIVGNQIFINKKDIKLLNVDLNISVKKESITFKIKIGEKVVVLENSGAINVRDVIDTFKKLEDSKS